MLLGTSCVRINKTLTGDPCNGLSNYIAQSGAPCNGLSNYISQLIKTVAQIDQIMLWSNVCFQCVCAMRHVHVRT